MRSRKTLDRGIVNQGVWLGGRSPVAVEGVQEGLRHDVEKWKDHYFIEEGEEEHRVRESSRQPVFCQSQPIFKNEHDASDSKRNADSHYCYCDIYLNVIAEIKVAGLQSIDPSDPRVHYWHTDISKQIDELDCGHDEVIGGAPKGMFFDICNRVPVVFFFFHYVQRIDTDDAPRSYKQFPFEVFFFLFLLAAVLKSLNSVEDDSLAGRTFLFLVLLLNSNISLVQCVKWNLLVTAEFIYLFHVNFFLLLFLFIVG